MNIGVAGEYLLRKPKIKLDMGIEYEFVLIKDNLVLGPGYIDYLTYKFNNIFPDINFSFENRFGRTPSRLEAKANGTVRSIDELIDIYDRVIKAIRDEGLDIRPPHRIRSGSIHLTLDIKNVFIDGVSYDLRSIDSRFFLEELYGEIYLIGSVGTPNAKYRGSFRVSTYKTLMPLNVGTLDIIYIFIDESDDSVNIVELEEPVTITTEGNQIAQDVRGDIRFRTGDFNGMIIYAHSYLMPYRMTSYITPVGLGLVVAIEYRFLEHVEREYLKDYLSSVVLMHLYAIVNSTYLSKPRPYEEGSIVGFKNILEIIDRSNEIYKVARGQYDPQRISDKAFEHFSRLYYNLTSQFDLSDTGVIMPRKEFFRRNIKIREMKGIPLTPP